MINSEWNDFWNSGKIDDYLKFKQTENQYYGINWEVRNGKDEGTCNKRANSWGERPFSYSPYC